MYKFDETVKPLSDAPMRSNLDAVLKLPVLITQYLQNLISLQTDNNTRSSDASPHLWNKLPASLREPFSPLYAYLNPSFSSLLSTPL